jgi:hypothetical protein
MKDNNSILTIAEIKHLFPNEWILLGLEGDAVTKQDAGVVLLHGKDYLELCYKGSEIAPAQLTKIFYTGEQKHHRQWLKATRLKEIPKKT